MPGLPEMGAPYVHAEGEKLGGSNLHKIDLAHHLSGALLGCPGWGTAGWPQMGTTPAPREENGHRAPMR